MKLSETQTFFVAVFLIWAFGVTYELWKLSYAAGPSNEQAITQLFCQDALARRRHAGEIQNTAAYEEAHSEVMFYCVKLGTQPD